MNKRALSLPEILIAITIAVTVLVPVTQLFSTSGQSVQKSRNFSFATGLARRISQHLMIMKYKNIIDIPLPGLSLCDAADNVFFSPLFNFSNDQSGVKRITAADMPALYAFLNQFDFKYALSISNVSFGTGDEIKSVAIMITWKESGKDMMYRSYVYVPSI